MTQHLTDKTTPPPLPFLIMALESETEETKILKYWEQAIEKKRQKMFALFILHEKNWIRKLKLDFFMLMVETEE